MSSEKGCSETLVEDKDHRYIIYVLHNIMSKWKYVIVIVPKIYGSRQTESEGVARECGLLIYIAQVVRGLAMAVVNKPHP